MRKKLWSLCVSLAVAIVINGQSLNQQKPAASKQIEAKADVDFRDDSASIDTIIILQCELQRELRNAMFMKDVSDD
jgi:hypothetical protein